MHGIEIFPGRAIETNAKGTLWTIETMHRMSALNFKTDTFVREFAAFTHTIMHGLGSRQFDDKTKIMG
jgi:hypothetical protein